MPVSLADHDDRDERIGAALAEYESRCESGEAVDIWGFLSDHLDVATDLYSHFETLRQLKKEISPSQPPSRPLPKPADVASRERFEFVEELGGGGQGLVSLMWQPALSRLVAVKTLRPDSLANHDHLVRFENEARTVASLGHPNIVAIYETGHDEYGQPFFVMEYVEGETLRDLLSRGLLGFREVAELIGCLAEATHAAHAKGVTHRDLKPANVLLGRADSPTRPGTVRLGASDGSVVVPKLADFGLAWHENDKRDNLVQTAAEGDDQRVTQVNAILGTTRYMAPEQTHGRMETVGPGTDVYALGVILYECLTGHVPFSGKDMEETFDLIQRAEPVPPRRDRPKTPRDLETICLKCLEKDPAKRYASAKYLADDLRHFLAGEPIRARRLTVFGRLWKWSCRRPAAAALIALGTLGAIAFTAVILNANSSLTQERDRTAKQRDETAVQRDRARELLGLARKAVDDYTTRLSQDPRIRSRDLDDLRRELLRTAVAYYEAIVHLGGDDPEILEERAKGYGRLAEITADIGAKSDAIELYDKALLAFEELVRDHPEVLAYRRSLATTLDHQATLYRRSGHPDRVEAAYRRSIELWRIVADAPEATHRDRQAVAGVRGNMANYLRETGRPDEADDFYRQARVILEDLAGKHPGEPDITRDLAATYRHIGLVLLHTGRVKEAEEQMRHARDLGAGLVKAHPRNAEYKVHLGATLNDLAILYTDTGRSADARKAYLRTVELGEELVAAHSRVLSYQSDLAKALNNLGTLLDDLGEFAQSEKALLQARDIRLRLVTIDQTNTEFKHDLAGTFNNLAFAFKAQGKFPEADAAFAEALRLRDELARAGLPNTALRLERAMLLNNQANFHEQNDQPEKAQKARDEALQLLRALVKEFPNEPEYRHELSKVLNGAAGVATDKREWDVCFALYKEVLDLRQKLVSDHPTVTEYRTTLCTAHNNHGRAHHMMALAVDPNLPDHVAIEAKRFEQAEREYLEAIRIGAEMTKQNPTIAVWRHRYVGHLLNLATTYGEAHKDAKAEETFRAALAEANALERDFEPLPSYRALTAKIQNGLGVTLLHMSQFDLAFKAYREATGILEQLHREFPLAADFTASLGLNYGNLGEMTRDRKTPDTALGWYDKSITLLKSLHESQSRNANVRKYLTLSYRKRALFLTDLGRYRDALPDWEAAEAIAFPEMRFGLRFDLARCLGRLKEHARLATVLEQLARQPKLSGQTLYNLAVMYTGCAAFVTGDMAVPKMEREELAEGYAASAIKLLQQSRDGGYFLTNPEAIVRLQKHPDFDPLRGKEDFQKLLAEIQNRTPSPGGKKP